MMKVMAYLRGRGGRAEYWTGVLVGVALITVAGWFEDFTPKLLTWLAAVILWFILTPRRLRDIGWWTGLVLLPVVPVVIAIVLSSRPRPRCTSASSPACC